jgi:hypothetical protein
MANTHPGQAKLDHLTEAARDARSAALLALGTALIACLRAKLGNALVVRHTRKA